MGTVTPMEMDSTDEDDEAEESADAATKPMLIEGNGIATDWNT